MVKSSAGGKETRPNRKGTAMNRDKPIRLNVRSWQKVSWITYYIVVIGMLGLLRMIELSTGFSRHDSCHDALREFMIATKMKKPPSHDMSTKEDPVKQNLRGSPYCKHNPWKPCCFLYPPQRTGTNTVDTSWTKPAPVSETSGFVFS